MQWLKDRLSLVQSVKRIGYNLIGLVLLTLLLLLLRMPANAASPRHYTELQFEPPPEIQIPNYNRFQLDNGIVVYLLEDHELPLISGTALFRTGDRLEPADKIGLAGLTGQVMRTGGTQRHSADQLNELLEQQAATVETGIGKTSGSASFSALSEDLGVVFDLFAEVIQEPVFSPEKLELAKMQGRGGIARRNDDPNGIAAREFQKLIYGTTSPYARTVEYATLDNINRDDLVQFYRQYFHPRGMILGIVGDFNPQTMRSLIQKRFANWQPVPGGSVEPTSTINPPQASQAKQDGIFLVEQPQLTQSYIEMGHLGGRLRDPDYPALDVMNGVLNGFGGRLFNQLRSRQGLAYSVYTAWNPQYDYPGLFITAGQTRSEATVPFIQAVRAEIAKLRASEITAAELAYAKDSVLNAFVFNFQAPGQTLSRLMRYEYYNYPRDFIFRYQQGVKATTVADVQRVAQTYLKPKQLVTLVVGNQEAIQPPLTTLQPTVTPLEITIPEPGA